VRGFGNTQKGVQLIATKSWKAMAREPDTGHVQSSAVLPTGKFNLLCSVVIICLALGMPLSSLEPPRHTHHIPPDSFIKPPPSYTPNTSFISSYVVKVQPTMGVTFNSSGSSPR